MANNPYVNKVELADGTTLIDLTSYTVVASKIVSGYTAHDASGTLITGSIPINTYTDLSSSGVYIKTEAGYYETATALAISKIVVPAGTKFWLSSENAASVMNDDLTVSVMENRYAVVRNYGDARVYHPSNRYGETYIKDCYDIEWIKVINSGEWVTTTPTAYGTYYGKVVVSAGSILQAAYPVGSLYATESSSDNPATILGFGTWTKYAPADLNWNDTDLDWNNTVGVTSGIYVWKRTA